MCLVRCSPCAETRTDIVDAHACFTRDRCLRSALLAASHGLRCRISHRVYSAIEYDRPRHCDSMPSAYHEVHVFIKNEYGACCGQVRVHAGSQESCFMHSVLDDTCCMALRPAVVVMLGSAGDFLEREYQQTEMNQKLKLGCYAWLWPAPTSMAEFGSARYKGTRQETARTIRQ